MKLAHFEITVAAKDKCTKFARRSFILYKFFHKQKCSPLRSDSQVMLHSRMQQKTCQVEEHMKMQL